MSQKSAPVHWTYDDYLRLPDDGTRVEILDGQKFVTPAPTPRHQLVIATLLPAIQRFVEENDLGACSTAPIDVLLAHDTVVQPDLIFIARERLSLIGAKAIEGAPDLVVEVLSPSTRRRDHRQKRDLFERYGVREYWLVDPDTDRVEVFVLEDGGFVQRVDVTTGEAASPTVLPGFSLALERLFDTPGPRPAES